MYIFFKIFIRIDLVSTVENFSYNFLICDLSPQKFNLNLFQIINY
jgi:hypothetical protein